jgi:hypothetical protein
MEQKYYNLLVKVSTLWTTPNCLLGDDLYRILPEGHPILGLLEQASKLARQAGDRLLHEALLDYPDMSESNIPMLCKHLPTYKKKLCNRNP